MVGVGAVASAANSGPRKVDLRCSCGLPPETLNSSVGAVPLELERPDVFFGTRADRSREYVIVTPDVDQFQSPNGSVGVAGTDFPEGIQVSSTFRTLVLAWHFRSANLLFSSELTERGRLVRTSDV